MLLTHADLLVLRALETFPEGALAEGLVRETAFSKDWISQRGRCLESLGYLIREGQRYMLWRLTVAGRAFLMEAEGKIIATCKFCQEWFLVPEITASEYRELRCEQCGNLYQRLRCLPPDVEPEYPSLKGAPPTFLNRQNKVMWTYEPFQRDGQWICGGRTVEGPPCEKLGYFDNHRCGHHHGKGGRPMETGRYSKYLQGTTKDTFEEFLSDPELLDLKPEIALLRTKLVEELDEISPKVQVAICEAIGKLAAKYVERQQEMKYLVHVDKLVVLQQAVRQVILDDLSECPHCGKPLDDVRIRIANELGNIKLIEKPMEEIDEPKAFDAE